MSSARREKARENLRKEIMDAARELFVTESYKAISLRRIAQRIDYSPSAIYFYFKDKEEILQQLRMEGYEILAQLVFYANDAEDPIEYLRRSCHGYLTFAQKYPHYYKIMFQIDCDAPLERTDLTGTALFDILVQKIDDAIELKYIPAETNANATAAAIWASLHGLATLEITGMVMIEPREATEERLIEMTLRGIHA
jgi:AcrR family transcriptional regulator